MDYWEFLFVPTVLFMVVVAPIWIVMHYRSVNRSSRSLNEEDRQRIEDMLVTVDRLTERIGTLESILDDEHPDWRQQDGRGRSEEASS
jgi:phage shock protein B